MSANTSHEPDSSGSNGIKDLGVTDGARNSYIRTPTTGSSTTTPVNPRDAQDALPLTPTLVSWSRVLDLIMDTHEDEHYSFSDELEQARFHARIAIGIRDEENFKEEGGPTSSTYWFHYDKAYDYFYNYSHKKSSLKRSVSLRNIINCKPETTPLSSGSVVGLSAGSDSGASLDGGTFRPQSRREARDEFLEPQYSTACGPTCYARNKLASVVASKILCAHVNVVPTFDNYMKEFSPLRSFVSVLVKDLTEAQEFFISLIETALATFVSIYNSKNLSQAISIVILALKSTSVARASNELMSYIIGLVTDMFAVKASMTNTMEDTLRMLGFNQQRVLRSVVMALILVPMAAYQGLSLTGSNIATIIDDAYWATTFVKSNKGISLFTGIYVLSRYGYSLIKGGAESLDLMGDDVGSWYLSCYELSSYSTMLPEVDMGVFDSKGIPNIITYTKRLHDAMAIGKRIVGRLPAGSPEINFVDRVLVRLQTAQRAVDKYHLSSGLRKAPATILVAGESSVGKTFLFGAIRRLFGGLFSLPTDDSHTYRFSKEDHMNAYNTAKWCGLVDDPGAVKMTVKPDEALINFIDIINNAPYITPQADLADKGTIPLNIKCLVVTSNDEALQSRLYFTYPSAAARRFPFVIVPKVKADYQKAAGGIDPKLISMDMNAWVFDLKQPSIKGREFQIDYVKRDIQWVELQSLLMDYFREHDSNQEKFLRQSQEMNSRPVCPHGFEDLCQVCTRETIGQPKPSIEQVTSTIKCGVDHCASEDFGTFYSAARPRLVAASKRVADLLPDSSYVGWLGGSAFLSALMFGAYKYMDYNPDLSEAGLNLVPEWLAQHYTPSFTQVQVTSQKSTIMDQVRSSMRRIISYDENRRIVHSMFCFAVGGKQFISAGHLVNPVDGRIPTTFVICGVSDNPNNCNAHVISDATVIRGDGDYALYVATNHRPMKDITKYIISNKPVGGDRFSGRAILGLQANSTDPIRIEECECIGTTNLYGKDLLIRSNAVSGLGSCGSPVLVEGSSGLAIAGVLVMVDINEAHKNESFFLPIDQHSIMMLKNKISPHLQLASSTEMSDDPLFFSHDYCEKLLPLSRNSTYRWNPGCYEALGTRPKSGNTMKTKVFKTNYHGVVLNKFPEIHNLDLPRFKPLKNSHGVPINNTSPTVLNVRALGSPKPVLDDLLMAKIADSLYTRITSDDSFVKEALRLKPMTLDESLHGAFGEKRINFGTSMGYPENGPKKNLMEQVDPVANTFRFTPEQQRFYDDLHANIRQGKYDCPVFSGSLKDEVRARNKTLRMFTGANVQFNLIERQYFLPLLSLFKKFPFLTEQCIGVRSDSPQWTELATYLGEKSVGCGDFKNFDKNMAANVMMVAFNVLIRLLELGEYTETDIVAAYSIANGVCFPTVDIKNDIAIFNGTNPSGHALTTLINCVVNSIYHRYAWVLSGHKLEDFDSTVFLITFGDDCIFNSLVPSFNQNTMASQMASLGIVYTDHRKADVFDDMCPLEEAEFLKRSFHYYNGYYVDLLSLKSIAKMVAFGRKSEILEKERFTDACSNARSELLRYVYVGATEPRIYFLYALCDLIVRDHGNSHYREILERLYALDCEQYVHDVLEGEDLDGLFEARYIHNEDHISSIYVPSLVPASTGADTSVKQTKSEDTSDAQVESTQKAILTFADDPGAVTVDNTLVVPPGSGTYSGIESGGLKEVFARPVDIASGTVAVGGTLSRKIDSVDLLFSNPFVAGKMGGFGRTRFTQNYRLVINGNPAHQMLVCVSVNPQFEDNGGNRYTSSPFDLGITSSAFKFGATSVLPGPAKPVNVCDSPTIEWAIPWMAASAYGDVPDILGSTNTDYSSPQNIVRIEGLSALRSANGSLVDMSYTLYSWLTDVELIAPRQAGYTPSLTQASYRPAEENTSEYQISKISSRLASAFGQLVPIPVVGSYASLASKFMGKVSDVASVLGYSKPTRQNEVMPMIPRNVSSIANYDGIDSSYKLSWDSQQGIEPDRSLLGYSPIDELSVQSIASRSGLIGTGTINIGDPAGIVVFVANVTPTYQLSQGSIVTGEPRWMTPLAYATGPATYAGGGIVFTICFASSKWHGGRFVFRWTPHTTDTFTGHDTNENYSVLIDLHETTQVAIMVPWLNSFPVKKIDKTYDQAGVNNDYNFQNNGTNPTSTFDWNGRVSLTIVNELTAPGTGADVDYAVFAHAAEDFRIQGADYKYVPNLRFASMSPEHRAHCDAEYNIVPRDSVVMMGPGPQNEVMQAAPLYNFGEAICSFRAIAKRFVLNYQLTDTYSTSAAIALVRKLYHVGAFPVTCRLGTTTPNSVPDGMQYSTTSTNFKSPNVRTTFLSYVKHCYLGVRTGVRWKLSVQHHGSNGGGHGPDNDSCCRVSRGVFDMLDPSAIGGDPLTTFSETDFPTPDTSFSVDPLSGGAGEAVVFSRIQNVLSYEVPFYTKYRYLPGNAGWTATKVSPTSTEDVWDELSNMHSCALYETFSQINDITYDDVKMYCAAADDFDAIMFICSPIINTSGT